MNRRYVWSLAALTVGCAQGAPLETDGAGTLATTVMTMGSASMTTTMSSTTVDASTTDETTGSQGTTVAETTEGSGSTSGTSGGPEDGGELYPLDQVQSPITPTIAAALEAIAAKGPDKSDGVFAKIGGSSTASGNFMSCFADPMTIVGLDPGLTGAVDFFNTTMAGMGTTSFNRVSLAAMAGWTAAEVLAGMPAPLASEVGEISPRFAVVLFGTQELEQLQPDALFTFADNLQGVVDGLVAGGTVPILTTLPPRTMPPELAIEVPRYNALIRAIAQGYRVPLIDLNLALSTLPGQGLAADGIDLSVSVDANMVATPCTFDLMGKINGYNVRNLVTIEALDRARKVVVEGMPGPDTAPLLAGAGTMDKPFVIPGLPFSDMRSTQDSVSDVIDIYEGACAAIDESGPEYVYELTVVDKTEIRAMVFVRDGVDVDLHLLTLQDIKTCVKRDDKLLSGPLDPGTYYLAVDTLGAATPGQFALVVLPGG